MVLPWCQVAETYGVVIVASAKTIIWSLGCTHRGDSVCSLIRSLLLVAVWSDNNMNKEGCNALSR